MRFSSCPHESSQSGYNEKPLKSDCCSNHDEQQGELRMKAWKIKALQLKLLIKGITWKVSPSSASLIKLLEAKAGRMDQGREISQAWIELRLWNLPEKNKQLWITWPIKADSGIPNVYSAKQSRRRTCKPSCPHELTLAQVEVMASVSWGHIRRLLG